MQQPTDTATYELRVKNISEKHYAFISEKSEYLKVDMSDLLKVKLEEWYQLDLTITVPTPVLTGHKKTHNSNHSFHLRNVPAHLYQYMLDKKKKTGITITALFRFKINEWMAAEQKAAEQKQQKPTGKYWEQGH